MKTPRTKNLIIQKCGVPTLPFQVAVGFGPREGAVPSAPETKRVRNLPSLAVPVEILEMQAEHTAQPTGSSREVCDGDSLHSWQPSMGRPLIACCQPWGSRPMPGPREGNKWDPLFISRSSLSLTLFQPVRGRAYREHQKPSGPGLNRKRQRAVGGPGEPQSTSNTSRRTEARTL